MGKIMGIAVKRLKESAKMETLEEADITSETGIVGESRGGYSAQRRVIVLSDDQWQKVCQASFVKVPWEARLANILVRGVEFHVKDKGRTLMIGDHVELEITGAAGPCSGLGAEWQGGVLCRVVKGGHIKTGDEVKFKFNDES